jgi:hypothetical protein
MIFILACSSTPPKNVFNTASFRLLPEPDIYERLQYQKQLWDSGLNLISIRYFRVNGTNVLKRQIDNDSVLYDYDLLQDSSGATFKISEVEMIPDLFNPNTLTHYFDNEGKTFAVEFSESNEGGLFERIAYYDNAFHLIAILQNNFQAWDGKIIKSNLPLDTPLDFLCAPDLQSFLVKRKISLPIRH